MSSSKISPKILLVCKASVAALLFGSLNLSFAADPVTPQSNPEQFDRDGKHICGWSVMTESERAGFKSMLHNNNELADRDSIRSESCKAMRKRAQEKGVPLDE